MAIKTDNQLRLSDGRSIGYAEYGDPQGRPVLYFHGLPSSRFEMNNPDLIEIAERLHVRLILADRPGIGLSDFRPYTLASYLAQGGFDAVTTGNPEFQTAQSEVDQRVRKLLSIHGKRSPDSLLRDLGKVMWENVGMARNAAGLRKALGEIPVIREEFWKNVSVVGSAEDFNQCLERAGRVADLLEFAEMLTMDALARNESCGGHFREESQTEDGEAKRDDAGYSHASVWEYQGEGKAPLMHKEPLTFEHVKPSQRSYK